MNDELKRIAMLQQLQAAAKNPYQALSAPVVDTRPLKVRIEAELASCRAEMDRLAKKCDKLVIALQVMDEHPNIEALLDFVQGVFK